jgi:inosine/xanthosine triphosphate pyrophosphatase family protein
VFELTTPQELKLDIEIGSDNSSIQRTSHARARSYSRMSSLPTITAEAALYINALGGRPGAGVRTWGGQLSQPMSNEEIFNYMRAAVAPLDDTSAYIEGSITVVLPNGDEHHLRTRDYGVIDKDKLAKDFEAGQYPIGQVFRHDSCGATWVDMTAAQRRQVRQEKLDRVLGVLSESVQSLKKK